MLFIVLMQVERKMFHLSKELTGVLLPHDTYGSHLDNNGKTIDEDLEMKNFEAAGKTLAHIWSNLVIDGYILIQEDRNDVLHVILHLLSLSVSSHGKILLHFTEFVNVSLHDI